MCDNAEAQFNTVIDEYGRFLSQTIIRLCPKNMGLEVSDIEQEARLRLWHTLQNEREIRNPTSFLYRIALTATIDAVRRIKAKREEQLRLAEDEEDDERTPPALPSDPRNSPDLVAERRQLANKVRNAMSRLSDNRRRAVGLYLEGFSSREVADLLGWSEPKARNLIYRGLHDLRKQLCIEGIEYEIDK